MPLSLYLIENQELRLDVDLEVWKKAFERALRNDEVIQVENPRGGTLSINPHQVLYWVSEDSEPDAEARRPRTPAVPA
jgi:hypothetical protein